MEMLFFVLGVGVLAAPPVVTVYSLFVDRIVEEQDRSSFLLCFVVQAIAYAIYSRVFSFNGGIDGFGAGPVLILVPAVLTILMLVSSLLSLITVRILKKSGLRPFMLAMAGNMAIWIVPPLLMALIGKSYVLAILLMLVEIACWCIYREPDWWAELLDEWCFGRGNVIVMGCGLEDVL